MQSGIMEKLPIGWYLKEADCLITHFTNIAFESFGINRFHWQVLKNIDAHGKISKELYYHQVSRFLTMAELDEVLETLLTRNWICHTNDLYSFTDTGKQEYAAIEALQLKNREKIMEGISEEEYLAAINFLEKLIRNLGGKV
ncbi:MarR family winged helix-turn-helix transcriptional regulator [Chitinophaga polysaccharea]|uniref:MarR family winged helix-turn-helix transcriptional regulator n=1 Tax=Chitinophaga polysaccharea TaxID=1293035 RepID=UPI001159BE17|nr:MarR family winged helix-turn-helix transcriptional regulator [Chitinophaga polysaccharea]